MKNNTKMRVAKKYAHMLDEIYQEKNNGLWAYSKKGYMFKSMLSHTAHEYNQKELYKIIQTLVPCDCRDCTDNASSYAL